MFMGDALINLQVGKIHFTIKTNILHWNDIMGDERRNKKMTRSSRLSCKCHSRLPAKTNRKILCPSCWLSHKRHLVFVQMLELSVSLSISYFVSFILLFSALEPHTSKRPISDQYSDFDKMKKTGIPMPLADKPIISRMADRHLTLSWKPSIPHGPRFPVTYQVRIWVLRFILCKKIFGY